MNSRSLWILLLLGAVLALGVSAGCSHQASNDPATHEPTVETPALADVATVSMAGIYQEPISLIDGEYEGEPFMEDSPIRPRVHLITELMPVGDLTGDRVDEVLALVEENSGGTGHFLHIAPFSLVDGQMTQLGHALVGDRVKIRSVEIEEGRIIMCTVQAGPEDGACCPTEKTRRVWTLRDGRLNEVETEIEGTMSLADFSGSEWVLTAFDPQRPAPSTPEVTFHLDLEDKRISGSSGCNNYFGTVESPGTRELVIGPLAGTKKMCPPEMMDVERSFLKALGSANSYTWFLGQMAISYSDGDDYGLLLFERKGPTQEQACN